jgi:hypothetical protein
MKIPFSMKQLILVLMVAGFACSGNSFYSDQTEAFLSYARQMQAKYKVPRKDYAIVIDYRQSIATPRLHLLDMKAGKSILSCRVAHAWNSGTLYATEFSNIKGTNMSCKGNFITLGTYHGGFGYSMQVEGLDKGINDRARERAIIFHSNKKMLTQWSWGCFATDEDVNNRLINLTKGGCLVSVIDGEWEGK